MSTVIWKFHSLILPILSALGCVCLAALGLAFVPLGSIGLKIPAIKFALNMYTGPGYLGALLGVMNIFLLVFLFKEYRLYPQHRKGGQCLKKKNKKKKEADRDEWDQLAQSMVKEEEAGKVDSQKLTNVDQDPSEERKGVSKRYSILSQAYVF